MRRLSRGSHKNNHWSVWPLGEGVLFNSVVMFLALFLALGRLAMGATVGRTLPIRRLLGRLGCIDQLLPLHTRFAIRRGVRLRDADRRIPSLLVLVTIGGLLLL